MNKISLALLIFFNCFLTDVAAQINTQSLKPAFNFSYVLLEDSSAVPILNETRLPSGSAFYLLQFNTVNSPLVMYDANGDNRRTVVSSISTVDLGVMYPFSEKWNVSLGLPLHSVSREDIAQDRFAAGDAALAVEYVLSDRFHSFWGVSLLTTVYAPVGERNTFVSNDSWGGALRLVLEQDFPWLTWAVNLGGAFYDKGEYQNVNYSEQWLFGTGVHVPVGKNFAMNLEAQTSYLKNSRTGPGDVYLGGQYALKDNARLDFGFAVAGVDGGGDSFRAVLGLKYVPGYEIPPPPPQIERVVERVTEVEIIKTTEHCGPDRQQFSFPARRLNAREKSRLRSLPYISSPGRGIEIRNIGDAPEAPGVGGRSTTVVFAVDLGRLPAFASVIKVDSAQLRLKVSRRAADSARDSAVLCILNEKVCSGELHEEESWKKNINQKFFQGKETPNDYFVRQLLEKAELNLELDRLIENSRVPDSSALLYSSRSGRRPRTLYLAVGPDIQVAPDATLDVTLTVDSCRTTVSLEGVKEGP